MFAGPEGNNWSSIIFRGEYQELQNNGLKYQNTDALLGLYYILSYKHTYRPMRARVVWLSYFI